MTTTGNVPLREGFTQACVWPGTTCGPGRAGEFEAYMLNEFGVRVQYLEEVLTGPDWKDGRPVPGTGGRNDLLFAVHGEDVPKFAVKRLGYGMQWVEDALANARFLYPEHVAGYKTWDCGDGTSEPEGGE